MPAIAAPKDIPRPGVNCPDAGNLETGDLLFPSEAEGLTEGLGHSGMVKLVVAAGQGAATVGNILGAERTRMLKSDVKTGLTVDTTLSVHQGKLEQSGAGLVDLSDPKNLYKLLKIIKAEFPALVDKWLTMPINTFIAHPMARFFTHALTSKDAKEGFFVGHVAMVIRESDGVLVNKSLGVPYVIECNVTDFAHYRVSIHRYHVDHTADTADQAVQRGWVNYRCSQGEKVWHAKPKHLGTTAATVNNARLLISNAAKAMIGRPYGFFDNPVFGDKDRMYCSEFVFNAYQSAMTPAQLPVDHQTWGWVQEFFQARNPKVGDLVKSLIDDPELDIAADKPFFLLTPPMLWKSANMHREFSPGNKSYA